MSYSIGKAPLNIDPQFSSGLAGTGNRPRTHIYGGDLFILADGANFQYREVGGALTASTYAAIGMPEDVVIQYSCVTSSGILVRTAAGATYVITSPTTSTTSNSNIPLELVDCTALGDGSSVFVAGFRPTVDGATYTRELKLYEGSQTTGLYTEVDLSAVWTDVSAQCYPYIIKRDTDEYVLLFHQYTTNGAHDPVVNSYDIHCIGIDTSALTTSVSNISTVDTVAVPYVVAPFEISGRVCFWGKDKMYAYDGSTYTTFTNVFADADLIEVSLSGDAPSSEKAVYGINWTFSTADGVVYTKTGRVVAGYATKFETTISGLGNTGNCESDILLRLTEKHFPTAGFTYLASDSDQIDRFIVTDANDNELELKVYECNPLAQTFKAYLRIPPIVAGGIALIRWDFTRRQVRQKTNPYEGHLLVIDGEFDSMRNLVDGKMPYRVDQWTDALAGGTSVGGAVDGEECHMEWDTFHDEAVGLTGLTQHVYINSGYTSFPTNASILTWDNQSGDYFGLHLEDGDRCDYYGTPSGTTWFSDPTWFTLNTDVAWACTGNGGNGGEKYLVYEGTDTYFNATQSMGMWGVDARPAQAQLKDVRGNLYIARLEHRYAGVNTTLATQCNYMGLDSVSHIGLDSNIGSPPVTIPTPINGIFDICLEGYTAPSTDFEAVVLIDERYLPAEFWTWVTGGNDYTGEIVVQDHNGVDLPTKQVHLDAANKQIELNARITVSATGKTYIKVNANTGKVQDETGLYDNLYIFAFSNRDSLKRNLIDDVVATVDGVGQDADGKFNGDTMLYWNDTAVQSLATWGMHCHGRYYNSDQQTLMAVGSQALSSNARSAMICDNGNERGGWATQGSWLYGGNSGTDCQLGGSVCQQIMHERDGQGRQLFYQGLYDNQTSSSVTNTAYEYIMIGAGYSGQENLTGWVEHARISIGDETVWTAEHLEFEAKNLDGRLQTRFVSEAADQPIEAEFSLSYDLSWAAGDVTDWVCKITEAQLPTGWWELEPDENRLAVYDQNGFECQTYVAHFDDVTETLSVYAKIPTMTAGITNTITLRLGGAIKAHTTDVFSDYVAVVDLEKNIDTDVTGLLSTISGVSGLKPVDNYFNDNYMYIDVSANTADFLANGASCYLQYERDVGNPQGDASGIRLGTSGAYQLVSFGNGDHFQSYRSGLDWINNETDGFPTLAETRYSSSVVDDIVGGTRAALVDETHIISEATGAGMSGLDRYVFGNAGDRTSFAFNGYMYEARLSYTILDYDHIRMNNYGLLASNIVSGSLVVLSPTVPTSRVFNMEVNDEWVVDTHGATFDLTDFTVGGTSVFGVSTDVPNGSYERSLKLNPFDGGGQFTVTPVNPADYSMDTDFTVEYWIKFTDGAVGTYRNLMNSYTAGWNADADWISHEGSVDGSNLAVMLCVAQNRNTRTATVDSAEWNHVAVERVGSTVTVYVNGNPVSTTFTDAGNWDLCTVDDKWCLGGNRWSGDQSYLGALVCGMKVYSEAIYQGSFTPS